MSVIASAPANPAHPWIAAEHANYGEVTALIADPVLLRPAGRRWWIALGASGVFVLATVVAIFVLFTRGIGVWGVNSTVVWGYAIASYVWWIAIGSGGTLISAMLLITRQRWRASVNRFAETMTIFAVSISGLFPILHLGRPQYFYWLAPYPNTMLLWPQWRSALVWDFWAIVSYLLFSLLFLYIGLLPDLATMRDRATTVYGQVLYGAFALGWRGSAHHWRCYETFQIHTGRAGCSPCGIRAFDRRPRLCREPDAGLAGDDLSTLLRRRRIVFRLCLGRHSDGSGAVGIAARGRHHDSIISMRWQRFCCWLRS